MVSRLLRCLNQFRSAGYMALTAFMAMALSQGAEIHDPMQAPLATRKAGEW
jgi:hypothetical protein